MKGKHGDRFKKREGRVDQPTEKEGNGSFGSNPVREHILILHITLRMHDIFLLFIVFL